LAVGSIFILLLWVRESSVGVGFSPESPDRKAYVKMCREGQGAESSGITQATNLLLKDNAYGVAFVSLDQTQRTGYRTSVNKKAISEVMRHLGRQKSAAKAKASRINGRKGGRPRKGKE
jgi:hypothetical protein